jgi:hypothetical protein
MRFPRTRQINMASPTHQEKSGNPLIPASTRSEIEVLQPYRTVWPSQACAVAR